MPNGATSYSMMWYSQSLFRGEGVPKDPVVTAFNDPEARGWLLARGLLD